jgi:hypothetical protein
VAGTCRTLGEKGNLYIVLMGNREAKGPLGRPTCDGMTILKWALKKCHGKPLSGVMWFRIGTGDGIIWTR